MTLDNNCFALKVYLHWMEKGSFKNDVDFSSDRIITKVVLESNFTKEIRILLKEGLEMKEHKTPHPIVVQVFSGTIDFGENGNVHRLETGDIIALNGGIPHNLKAIENSIVRLSLSKQDQAERAVEVANNSSKS